MGLRVLNFLPEGILDSESHELVRHLGGPTLIELEGQKSPPLFICVLQHGNETTGWDALRQVLKNHQTHALPRSLMIFVANVRAASQNLRKLDHEPDFNRCWPINDLNEKPEEQHSFYHITQQVIQRVKQKRPFANIDLHNNTGLNPHYGAVNSLENGFLQLATLFSRTVVYFETPKGVQSMAMANYCPSVTLECGQVGQHAALDHAIEFIQACMHLDHIPDKAVSEHDIDLFHTLAIIKVNGLYSFDFGSQNGAIHFTQQLDHMNFRELPANTEIGTYDGTIPQPLIAMSESGLDITHDVFDFSNQSIRLKKAYMPAMLTLDHRIIRQDCLCYFMERLPYSTKP